MTPRSNPSFNVQWAGKPAGSIDPTTGYLRLMIDGVHAYVHRIIWLHTKGWLPSVDLDHHDETRQTVRCGICGSPPTPRTTAIAARRLARPTHPKARC